jgi:tRNA pseudouridine55 synthase
MTPHGLLLVHKPAGLTSHDVVLTVRRILGVRRVGHTGTLDPMAEGLLLLLVGEATRHQRVLQGHEKTYEATLRLGVQTDTGDATGRPIRRAPVPPLTDDDIRSVLAGCHGSLAQTPPAYSAVKVRGRPAYWWTRRRQPVSLAPRIVHIRELALLRRSEDTVTVRVRCSAGTYIRTLAEQIAERLGTVGHLSHLIRWQVGGWSLEHALAYDVLRQASGAWLASQLAPVNLALPAAPEAAAGPRPCAS